MTEKEEVKSKRELFSDRLRSKYPDRNFEDDEDLFGQVNEDYDSFDSELSAYKDNEKKLTEMFASNPRNAAFLTDWRNGEDPIVGLIRKYGDELKDALEDPEKADALAAANKEYAERIAQDKAYEEAYQQNLMETCDVLDQVQEEDGLSDEQIDSAMAFLLASVKDGVLGKFSAESIRMAVKALNHDADVANAEEIGEVRGRNTKIEEKLRKPKGDNMPALGSKNGGSSERNVPDLGALNRYDGAKSIWERGGERRIKY